MTCAEFHCHLQSGFTTAKQSAILKHMRECPTCLDKTAEVGLRNMQRALAARKAEFAPPPGITRRRLGLPEAGS
jgi:hypothetical protein